MNVIVRTTPSSAESRKPLPLNKKPFLNRYEGLDLPPIQYRPTCKKEPKRHFALKFDLLLIGSWLFWHFVAKRTRGTRLIILVCRTSWSNCDLKNKYRTIVATSRCQSIMCSKWTNDISFSCHLLGKKCEKSRSVFFKKRLFPRMDFLIINIE